MGLSATDKLLIERIENGFTWHAPTNEQALRYADLRRTARTLAIEIIDLCPNESETALTKLAEVVIWVNAGLARQGE